MRNAPISADEIANTRYSRVRTITVGVSSVDGIARALSTWSYEGAPLHEPMVVARCYLNRAAQQVQEEFKTYIKPSHLTQVVVGPVPEQHRETRSAMNPSRSWGPHSMEAGN